MGTSDGTRRSLKEVAQSVSLSREWVRNRENKALSSYALVLRSRLAFCSV
ncbi:hypothetical protein F7734_14300 [Scytonema sp. UIC 10036]|nr:hypothetical protein [Scytonema sp. UIC 10036]